MCFSFLAVSLCHVDFSLDLGCRKRGNWGAIVAVVLLFFVFFSIGNWSCELAEVLFSF